MSHSIPDSGARLVIRKIELDKNIQMNAPQKKNDLTMIIIWNGNILEGV